MRLGLSCTNRVLKLSPGWPRMLALYGYFHFHESLGSINRRFHLKEAATAFQKAFAGNANLRNRYGGTAKEVERRLAEMEAGR